MKKFILTVIMVLCGFVGTIYAQTTKGSDSACLEIFCLWGE